MQSCIAEAAAEEKAQQHAALAPVRELEKTLNADRQEQMRNARYGLSLPDYPYFLEICPSFSQYAGEEGNYLDSVRNTFLEFKERLDAAGVNLTQAGLESLAELSDNNTSLNWTDARTFNSVWEHMCEVGYARQGRDYTVTEQKQPEPAPVKPREPQAYEDLRTAAEAEYVAMARPVWNDFQTYLMENWGVALTTSQQHEALETAKRLNLNPCIPDSWITVKNNLVRRQVLPECRTVDERLSAFIETVPDVSSPTGRRAIAEERNRLMSEEYKKH